MDKVVDLHCKTFLRKQEIQLQLSVFSFISMEHLQAYIDSLDKEPESEEDEGEEEKREDLLSQSNSVNELQIISSVCRRTPTFNVHNK